MPQWIWKSASSAALLASLTACGGGSNGSSTGTQYPVNDAIGTFYQTPQTYTLHADSSGTAYTLVMHLTPGPQTTFLGQQALTAVLADSITSNGTVVAAGGKTVVFLSSPFKEIGGILPGGVYEVDTAQHNLPDLAGAGAFGTLDSQTYFSDSTLTTQVGTGTRTWALDAVTEQTAKFCIDDTDDLGGSQETEGDCEIIDARGNVTGLQITLTLGAATLIFK